MDYWHNKTIYPFQHSVYVLYKGKRWYKSKNLNFSNILKIKYQPLLLNTQYQYNDGLLA